MSRFHLSGKVKIIMSMLIFGSMGPFVREIPLPSSAIALIRGVIGVVFLLLLHFAVKGSVSKEAISKNAPLLIAAGAALGANWIFLFEAYRHTTIAVATLSYYFAPIFVVVASTFLLKEKLTPVRTLCIFTALLGMIFVSEVFTNPGQGVHSLAGIGFGMAAALCYASITMLNKFIKGIPSMQTTIVQIGVAAAVLLPYTLISGGFSGAAFPMKTAVLLLILSVVHTGLAFWLYFSSLQDLKAQTAASISYIDPLTAILISTLFLHEEMSLMQMAGAIMILGATFINVRFSGASEAERIEIRPERIE